jgi:shikimate kinase
LNIVLIGFMCSGKSRVGKELASRLGWTFLDTDELVTQAAGQRISDIFRKQGESAFRAMEAEAVKRAAASDKAVIATGGGVPLHPGNMNELSKNGQVVWLKVSPRAVLRRAGDFGSRPLIDPSDPVGSITRRLQEREPLYRQAPHAIDTDAASPADVVEKILSMFPQLS